ncbi:SRPBCC family protein [Conexibacter sp. SYSU D00693]|uniref:SRPBCC family protein n=1 Tax=Conexibacter sp. SYSU D00693 TaxID=2812560 RepID=UPI00196B2998|nr:SRPBCC family protein [Conexibacter sp. SYSU D00693]
MQQAVDAVRREVVVDVSQERAFEVFTGRMTTWWPAHHHIGQAPIEDVLVEPREGGRWYTRHTDGSETSTGYVDVWEPHDRVVLTWQITADWRYDPGLRTLVEVRFVAEAPGRTRVVLEHRGLEAYGAQAEHMRQTFDAPDAWEGTLAAFAGAVAA